MRVAKSSAVGVALGIALVACDSGARSEERAERNLPNDTSASDGEFFAPVEVAGAVVTVGDLRILLAATGTLYTQASVLLRSDVGATVQTVYAKPGDLIMSGQKLAELDSRPFQLDLTEARSGLAQAEAKYNEDLLPDSILTKAPPSPVRRATALANSGLLAAQARVDRALLSLEKATIRAPFTSTVQRVAVVQGEKIAYGQELFQLVDLAHLRAEAAVLEHDVALVRVGAAASLTTPAEPHRVVRGRVTAVLPLLDSASRSARIVVAFLGDGILRPGMSADLEVETSTLRSRLVVPTSAIIERDGRTLVFAVRNGRAEWVYVLPGTSALGMTELRPDSSAGTKPVVAGDTVLTRGHLTLTHGARVRVVVTPVDQQKLH
ncbi:MAG: efflux RND transporter periplasmic adaptor subunit [Gemmatimonadota bacterium]